MHHTLKYPLAACAVTLSFAAPLHAQQNSQPLWELGVFAGGASTPAYPASSERSNRAIALPYVIYRGDILRSDRGGVGLRLFHNSDVEFDVGLASSLPASSDNLPARKGMSDLGTLIEFGPRVKWTFARPTPLSQWRLEVPLRTVLEVNNGARGQGTAFEPEVVYEAFDPKSGIAWSAKASVVLGDQQLNDYFYGVATPFATATRPSYNAQSGLIATRLSLSASTKLGQDWRLFGFTRLESYANAANRASPLYQQQDGIAVGLGVAWTFARSESRARD